MVESSGARRAKQLSGQYKSFKWESSNVFGSLAGGSCGDGSEGG